MAFSEKIKLEAKRKSAFRCCICHQSFVEVHHIVPQYQGGSDKIDNAAPLCSSCHDLFGDNPSKRKQIREMRDFWWDTVESMNDKIRRSSDFSAYELMKEDPQNKNQLMKGQILLYHNITEADDFNSAANSIFKLLEQCKKNIAKTRLLFIDIQGHFDQNSGFDKDMFELQFHFIPNVIFPFLSECYMPLAGLKNMKHQRKKSCFKCIDKYDV